MNIERMKQLDAIWMAWKQYRYEDHLAVKSGNLSMTFPEWMHMQYEIARKESSVPAQDECGWCVQINNGKPLEFPTWKEAAEEYHFRVAQVGKHISKVSIFRKTKGGAE